jgi:CheY-like chemotaxis protein
MFMPGMDGQQVAEAMRTDPALAGVPVVAMSGADRFEAIPAATQLCLSKPAGLKEGEVLALIRSALATVRADYVTRERPRPLVVGAQ